jgi:hypothetical protein
MLDFRVAAGIVGLLIFLFLSPRVKVLIAFFVMTSCFDVAPRIMFNKDVWDVGALLLAIAWLHLAFLKVKTPSPSLSYVVLIQVFIGWMFVCLLWSLLINDYPVLNTLKASRQMILGFVSFFVFKRLFATDHGAFSFLMKSSYVATFALLPITLAGHVLHEPLLFGLHREYGEVVRSLPVFLPISLLHFWIISSKFLTADKVAKHELLYAGMVIVVTALTFTRGIYFSVLFVFGVMLITLMLNKKLHTGATLSFFSLSALCAIVLFSGGYAERIIERFSSAVDLVFTGNAKTSDRNQDTYTGRLALAKERFELVAERNPIIGYGFIHEENVPSALSAKLKYGSVINTPEYVERYRQGQPYVLALHSADIGWADILINTGIFGLILWIVFFTVFVVDFFSTAGRTQGKYYHARIGLFLQTLVGVLLMFESNTFVSLVQIAMFMLAGCWYCASRQPQDQSTESPTVLTEMVSA